MKQFIEPEWVAAWKEVSSDALTTEELDSAVRAVRAGATLEQTMQVTGLDLGQALDAIAAVGSRCTQIGKHQFKITDIVASPTGRAEVTQAVDGWVVAASDGWLRTRRKRDVRRSYAALLVASEAIVADALTRTANANETPAPVRYTHYADLYNAARGTLPPLHKVTMNQPSVVPYLQAWDAMDARAHQAVVATRELLKLPPVDRIPGLLADSWWLLPNTRIVHMAAKTILTAESATMRNSAAARLGDQVRRLADLDRRQPTRLRPNRLEQLSTTQFRAIAARDGFRPGEGFGSRDDTSLARFAEQAKAALAAL